MKTRTVLSIVVLSFVLAAAASAATLSYQPEKVTLAVPAGAQESVTVSLAVTEPKASTYFVTFIDGVAGGNLPSAWLTASPSRTFFSRWSPAVTTLTVKVPEGTPAGTYAGTLLSRAMATHGVPDRGKGVLIEVTVPPNCSGVPSFEIESFAPQILWPPDHSMTQVIVTGKALVPDGCSLVEIGYAIEDEYGVHSSVGRLEPGNGSFSLALPVEASREGRDKDGRHYTITLYARDEAGLASADPLEVVVPHDMREK